MTDAGELATLAAHGITSISLAARAFNQDVKIGANAIVATSTFTKANGGTGTIGAAALAYRPTRMRSSVPAATGLGSWVQAKLEAMGREPDGVVIEHAPAQVALASLLANDPGTGSRNEAEAVASEAVQLASVQPNLESQLAALRRGFDGDLLGDFVARMPISSLAANDLGEDMPTVIGAPQEQIRSGPIERGDLRPLLMAQSMAAFGAKSGEGEWRERSAREAARFDYSAS